MLDNSLRSKFFKYIILVSIVFFLSVIFVSFDINVTIDFLNEYLSNADIFVQASNYEGLPHSILEAINYEIPILSTEVGGCSVLLNKGERGYIIPLPISETGISDGIRTIINNKKEAMSKAKVAKEFLNQQHNLNMNADIYHENINEMFN